MGGTATDLLLRVVGYYSKPVQTVLVHPVSGNNTASGAALINAVGAIITASATKRFVVKVEPGIYDVGTTGLTMKPFVDIEGSGEEATVIQGPGAAASTTAVLYGAASAELRNLQVKSTASSTDAVAVPILLLNNTRISHVTVTASGPSTSILWGIRLVGSASVVNDTTINLSGGGTSQGLTSKAFAAPKIHNTHITVTGYMGMGYGILVTDAGSIAEMDGLHIEVSGSPTGYGYYQDNSATAAAEITGSKLFVTTTSGTAWGVSYIGNNLRISRSTIRASGPTSYGIDASSFLQTSVDNSEITGATATVIGSADIGGSKLDGGAVSGSVTCAGVWDESYTFFTSACP